MAQECGFFNAQLVGEEFDRVYLAEQFAAYFAAFIGNGIYGHSMQKLQVLCQDVPNMSIKVLSGEAYINGWWYRNKDTYNISIPIADGILSRIDVVVVRWGNAERDMWLQLIKGIPSANPVKPPIRRDADYYDLQLATISVPAGAIRITQTQIQDTRLDNAVCGLVTGVVDQIDTTNLYNQFESYFQDFKNNHEADYDQWTAEQKQAYIDYITSTKNAYDIWVSNRQDAYDQWTSEKMIEYTEYTENKKDAYDSFVSQMEKNYNDDHDAWVAFRELYEKYMIAAGKEWKDLWETWFYAYVNDNSKDIADWKHNTFADFMTWWDSLRDILDENCCSQLTQAVVDLAQQVKEFTDLKHDLEYGNAIWSPLVDDGYRTHEIILDDEYDSVKDSDSDIIMSSLPSSERILDSDGNPIEFRRIIITI